MVRTLRRRIRAEHRADRRIGVRLTAGELAAILLSGRRPTGHTGPMRAVCTVLAIIGGCALAAAVAIELATGHPAGVGWVLLGPAPFYAVGLAGTLRGRGHPVAAWLLAAGTTFMLGICLGDAIIDLPAVAGSDLAWIVLLIGECASNASVVAGIGLIALFPTGVPHRRAERLVLRTAALTAVLLPVLLVITSPTPPESLYQPAEPGIASPLFLPALRPLEPVAAGLEYTFATWIVLGAVMLFLRYRRSQPEDRRRIRWLLVGMGRARGLRRGYRGVRVGQFWLLWSRSGFRPLDAGGSARPRLAGRSAVPGRSLRHRPVGPQLDGLPGAVADHRGGVRYRRGDARPAGQPVPADRGSGSAGHRRHAAVPARAAKARAAGGQMGVRSPPRRL